MIETDLRVTTLDHIRSFFKAGLDFYASKSEINDVNFWKKALSELDGTKYPRSVMAILRDNLESHWDDPEFQAKEAFLRAENLVVTCCFKSAIEQTKASFRLKRLE